jgi:lysozyme family protein
MTLATDKIINEVVAREGGYADHASDRGGPTMYGITAAVARANGYEGDMRNLPLTLARSIYERRYIVEPRFDQVLAIHEGIGVEMIDTGVNMGPARAAEFLQRWLNAFNARGSKYADMFVDGRLGPISLDCLRKYLAWRGQQEGGTVLLRALNAAQAMRYLEIAEANPSQEDFIYGWVRERVTI